MRRKIGVAALVMACVFMGCWMRSLQTCDVINVPLGKEYAMTFSQVCGSFVCRAGWMGQNPWDELDWSDREVASLPEVPNLEYLSRWPLPTGEGGDVTWYFIGCGFGFGQSSSIDPYHRRSGYLVAPYWSIVLTLTLLSAYLLMSKPCRSTLDKIVESVSEEVE